MAARHLPRAMDIQKAGSSLESLQSVTIRASRMRRCSGITITRWGSTVSMFSPGFLARSSCATNLKMGSGFREGNMKSRWSFTIGFFDLNRQLNYPVSPDPEKPWTPEVFGDAIVINGKIFPYLEVEPRNIAFAFLMAPMRASSISRCRMRTTSSRLAPTKGLLPAPLQLDQVFLAPGERADVIIDFAGLDGSNLS